MASTLTKTSAGPCSLKYLLETNSNGSNLASKTAAQLIADCAAGPLKAFLTQAAAGLNAGYSGLTWAGLDQFPQLSVRIKQNGTSGSATSLLAPTFETGATRFQVSTIADGSINCYVEIRYWPSAVR